MTVQLSRQTHFSAAHRYFQPELSEQENKRIFGLCYSEHGHGHNYVLEASIQGQIDAKTGMVINLTDLDAILKSVTVQMDHKHLNKDVPYFEKLVPTTENIAKFCWLEIQKRLPSNVKLHRVRLYENHDLWADFYG